MNNSKTTSRYHEIYQTIRDEIVRGTYKSGEKLPTGSQLCARFKVAKATIGRAIDALEQDGLIHRRQGAGTFVKRVDQSHGAKPRLTFFAPFVERNKELNYVESLIVQHLTELTEEDHVRFGFRGLRSHYGTTEERFLAATEAVLASKPDGVLYYPAVLQPEQMYINTLTVDRLLDAGCKVVLIDREMKTLPYRSELTRIGYDNVRGGVLLVNHLLSVGCNRIAFVGSSYAATSIEDRMTGYLTGLFQNEIPIDPNLIFRPTKITREFCEQLMESQPDAIICFADRICAKVGQHFAAMGVRIGKDIKMTGFDDDPIASLLPVPLTTIRLPAAPFAKAAYDAIMRRIKSNGNHVRQILIDCELIVRESTVIDEIGKIESVF